MRRFFSADSALPLLDVHAVRRRRGRLDSAENSAALTKQLFRQCGVAAGLTYTRYACALAPGLDGKIIGADISSSEANGLVTVLAKSDS